MLDGEIRPNLGRISNSNCVAYCSSKGWSIAGTEYGGQCYCGNSLITATKIDEASCSMACEGDGKQTCGGGWALSLYTKDGKVAEGPPRCAATCTTTCTAVAPPLAGSKPALDRIAPSNSNREPSPHVILTGRPASSLSGSPGAKYGSLFYCINFWGGEAQSILGRGEHSKRRREENF